MKKLLCCLFLLCLTACGNNEKIVFAPSSAELGNMCTIVSEFDNDVYNISLFYTENENYPILNKDDFNYINQLALKYSDEGSKDVSKYKINQNNAYKLCNIEKANVVNVAIQIPDSNILKFMSELRKYEFNYQVEKENEIFKVAMPNNVLSTTSLEINYTRVYSQKINEDEQKLLKEYKFNKSYNISLDEEHSIDVNGLVVDLIKEDGTQIFNQSNRLVGLGETVQLLVSVGVDESISADYVPIATLAKLLKSDVNESTYVQFDNRHFMISDLKDYILYETEEFVVYDLNPYLYGSDLISIYTDHISVSSVNDSTYEITKDIINEEQLKQIYNDITNQVKTIIK